MGENHRKAPCFCVLRSILATFDPIFEPSVGSFCRDFLSNGFFDSIVGCSFLNKIINITIEEQDGIRKSKFGNTGTQFY